MQWFVQAAEERGGVLRVRVTCVRMCVRVCAMCVQTLYNAMLENNVSEHASRMSAMENSTKSAGEMLGRLTLSYNR